MSDTELMAKSAPVRRLEIFTGHAGDRAHGVPSRRHRSSPRASLRASVSLVARRHGLTQQLFTWRRRFCRGQERLSFASVIVSAVPIEIEYGGATILVSAGIRELRRHRDVVVAAATEDPASGPVGAMGESW